MIKLDIPSFPLHGRSLIEASAGTGKTYTIDRLYRRAALGHGIARPLSCTEILVVTFTKAATEELRGRIRDGQRDVFEQLLLAEQGGNADAETQAWLDELCSTNVGAGEGTDENVLEPQRLSELQIHLQLNLAQMDESAILTIHKFCAQMLKRFAFDSGVGFNLALEIEGDEYLRRACEDVWRNVCYPEERDVLQYITHGSAQSDTKAAKISGPDALFHRYRSWMSKPTLRTLPELTSDFASLWEDVHRLYDDIAQQWQSMGHDDIRDAVMVPGLNKRTYSSKHFPNWMTSVGDYFAAGKALPLDKNLSRFGAAMLAEKTDKGEPPSHALFSQIDQLIAASNSLATALDRRWFSEIYARYLELLQQANVMTSDDLLRLLDSALSSDRGDELAAQIRRLYPLAMIDEFQDTDPVQYRIFDRIYPSQSSIDISSDNLIAKDEHLTGNLDSDESSSVDKTKEVEPALIMIGDPKQAIYAFRGADIFTYMKASDGIAEDRRFTLDTNHRSHTQLIAAVNQIWQRHERPFVFEKSIEFYPVGAAGRNDASAPQWESGVPTQPLQIWTHDEEESKAEATQRVADECAQQIAGLMAGVAKSPVNNEHTVGQATSNNATSKRKTKPVYEPVQAGQIAVLVYSRVQAQIVRDALSARGIGSVFLTRDSVLDSEEAQDWLAILEAVAHPGNEAAVRRAIASPTWGMTADELVAMQTDEYRWEAQLATMHEYHQVWQRRGVMAMLMQWLEDKHTDDQPRAVRLRKRHNGERILTNLLHLGEMLQAQSRKLRGAQALIRWFAERTAPDAERGEEAQLRLETDDRLVNIVTIHKSKGLEYDFVFLPFLWADTAKPHARSTEVVYYNGRELIRDLAPDDTAKKLQQRDTLAEQMRLLYVALTRAKFGMYLWLPGAVGGRGKKKVPIWHDSALGHLLCAGAEDVSFAELSALTNAQVYIGDCVPWQLMGQNELDVPPPPVRASDYQPRPRDHWKVSSFSQLASHSGVHHAESAAGDLSHSFDWEAAINNSIATTSDELPLALRFPKGANPGTCLHAIFEHWDFHDPDALRAVCETQLTLHGLQDQPVDEVAEWISQGVNQELALYDTQMRLADLSDGARLDEMEFYLPIGHLSAHDVNRLLGDEKRFSFEPTTGYLKGFIDLIFEWQGRYYVADYKSNHLGNDWQDYVPEALKHSMKDHRYDLQAALYMLALDQLLSQRLPNYEPQRHLGGSVYLYLRGMGQHFDHSLDPDIGVCFTPASPTALQAWRETLLTSDTLKVAK